MNRYRLGLVQQLLFFVVGLFVSGTFASDLAARASAGTLTGADSAKIAAMMGSGAAASSNQPALVEENKTFKGGAKSTGGELAFVKLTRSLGYDLKIYGADFFQNPADAYASNEMAPVNGDHQMGPGDEIEIRIWGSIQNQVRTTVDRAGQIYIPQVGAVSVTGVAFKDLDQHLKTAIGKYFRNFEVQSSLGKLRGIQVYVTGNANSPGTYSVSAMSSMTNLLLASGGPNAQGSYRNIELHRGGKLVGIFDLYALLLRGDKSSDLSLQNGDVIFIPTAKQHVALGFGVQHPGIYEFRNGESLYDLLKMAGGLGLDVLSARFHSERIVSDSGLRVNLVAYVDSGRSYRLNAGEILRFDRAPSRFDNAVTLRGHVLSPGRIPFKPGMRVLDLIPNTNALITDDFWNFQNNRDGDGVNSIKTNDHYLSINWEYAVIERFRSDSLSTQLIPFQLGKAILDKDASQNVELQAGDVVTVFSTEDVGVPVDKRPVYVTIDGEVNRVGTYKMRPGQTLHQLIELAGGTTPNAYIFGTKFTRPSTAVIQQANYERVLDEMQRQFESNASAVIANATGDESAKAAQQEVEAQRAWFAQLHQFKPDGRMVMGLAPSLKLQSTDLPDVKLESGDHINIPSTPSSIEVFGEVPRQSAFFYAKGDNLGDYISKAGGPTRYADDGSTFVIRADGSVISAYDYNIFLFRHLNGLAGMPGDALFVPKQLVFSHFMADLKDFSQVLLNFGLGAAAIVTLDKALK